MIRSSTLRVIILMTVVLMVREYAQWIEFLHVRPFVYRALIPALAQMLVWLGLGTNAALTAVMVISAIGFLYGLLYLSKSFHAER